MTQSRSRSSRTGPPACPTVETRLRVRYAETDQMGIVYYANYLVWMEVARVEWCRVRGFHYRDMEKEDGVLLVVAEAQCRYLAPAVFDDEVIIETRVAEAGARLIRFDYRMRHAGTGQVLAIGATKHVVCSLSRKPMRLPEKYRVYFRGTAPSPSRLGEGNRGNALGKAEQGRT
jgi:acyl-CoA thioester hydrolase